MHEAARRHLIRELAEGSARAARALNCPRCDQPVIKGDDDDEIAVIVTVDAETLDRLGETLAALDNRATYSLEPQTGKTARPGVHVIWHRHAERVNTWPRRGTVHAEHQCRQEQPK